MRPSGRCQLDHAVNYPEGPTTPENLGPLCRRDHNLKTHLGWRIDVHNDSTYTWTSQTGITYSDRPEPPLPDLTSGEC